MKITDNVKIGSWTRVVVLTGAGISAESGLKTFRDGDGLWENHKIEDVATPEAFATDPHLIWQFYRQRFHNAAQAEPNPAHFALSEMERKLGANFQIITQNVDGLHHKAGNNNVLEMHGSLYKSYCTSCHSVYNMQEIMDEEPLPLCKKCKGLLRPNIVWFGEIPHHLDTIDKLLRKCNVFIVIGTSGVVYPAAGFIMAAKYNGARTIGINKEKPHNFSYFDIFYEGSSGELLPGLVRHWLEFVETDTKA